MSAMNKLTVVFLNKVKKIKIVFRTAKLTHKKRRAKQATHITGSWLKNLLL